MDNLKEYIRQNQELIDDKEVPSGNMERFEALLDQKVGYLPARSQQPVTSGRDLESNAVGGRLIRPSAWRQGRGIRLRVISLAGGIAAAIAAVIFINHRVAGQSDWFAGVGDDQVEICNAYYEKVASLYDSILSHNPESELEGTLEAISTEAIPLVDQLPSELPSEARAAILKEYYSDILDGMKRISNAK